ncbi:MAG TPA: DUF3795 domain-containing protein [Chitinispirillaceae bacterium]|nr:DUF3795 domain-containing protein [Chitinispirillaceae bacterium]
MPQTTSLPVAYCGLYCGACGAFKKGRCPGCSLNQKASWCKIRSCCIEHSYQTCADCKEYSDPMQCKKFNNFVSKLFALVFKSDRAGCISQIKAKGLEKHAEIMKEMDSMSFKRK